MNQSKTVRNRVIVDAHLDLAYAAHVGRDVTLPAAGQARDEMGIPSVGLPDLRRGGVKLICATIFCEPRSVERPGYTDARGAFDQAKAQLDFYSARQRDGSMRFVRTAAELGRIGDSGALDAICLLEGADPIRTPDDLPWFFEAGVRIIGMAWKRTRFAGGTGEPGPLSDEGRMLVAAMDELGMIHDVSHLAEESFWELLDRTDGAVIASHSNCRAIVPGDRQLSDEMILALAKRDGVIGINFFDRFLIPPDEYKTRRTTLGDVARHIRHIADLTGSARYVGLGTDMDGGLGQAEIPEEIATSADLGKVGGALAEAGFGDGDIDGIMGGNWLGFFNRALPDARGA